MVKIPCCLPCWCVGCRYDLPASLDLCLEDFSGFRPGVLVVLQPVDTEVTWSVLHSPSLESQQ